MLMLVVFVSMDCGVVFILATLDLNVSISSLLTCIARRFMHAGGTLQNLADDIRERLGVAT